MHRNRIAFNISVDILWRFHSMCGYREKPTACPGLGRFQSKCGYRGDSTVCVKKVAVVKCVVGSADLKSGNVRFHHCFHPVGFE